MNILLFILSIFVFCIPSYSMPYIIAHRGASAIAPEGTKFSYTLAQKKGVAYLEGDVQRTRDGILIIYHDRNFSRTTDVNKKFHRRRYDFVGTFTLNEIKQLDAGSWFNYSFPSLAKKEYEDAKILTLDEFIDLTNGFHIYLETKYTHLYPELEKDLFLLLKRRNMLSKTYLESFSFESIRKLNELMPDVKKCFLVKDFIDYNILNWLKKHKLNCLGLPLSLYNDVKKYVPFFEIHVYTVNFKKDLLHIFKNSDSVFTDDPDIALETQLLEKFQ